MLVLSRKVGERLWIGDNISVTVVRVAGGGVRLGIEAPDDLPVVREELKGILGGVFDIPDDAGPVDEINLGTPKLRVVPESPASDGDQGSD